MTEANASDLQRRLSANATATSIVIGLLVAEVEALNPGAADRMERSLDALLSQIEAQGGFNKDVAQQVADHARVLLRTRNI